MDTTTYEVWYSTSFDPDADEEYFDYCMEQEIDPESPASRDQYAEYLDTFGF